MKPEHMYGEKRAFQVGEQHGRRSLGWDKSSRNPNERKLLGLEYSKQGRKWSNMSLRRKPKAGVLVTHLKEFDFYSQCSVAH